MPRDLVRTGSLVLALLGGTALSAGNAVAQQQPPAAEPQQQEQQEKAQRTPSGKMGKEEPSSHAPSTTPTDNSVFVDGALAVPGAPENTDTAPAKFSEKNAADDKLSIAAYTFKLLTEEQRRAIYTALKGQPAGPTFNADIGAELPSSVELRPMPDDHAKRLELLRTQEKSSNEYTKGGQLKKRLWYHDTARAGQVQKENWHIA